MRSNESDSAQLTCPEHFPLDFLRFDFDDNDDLCGNDV